MPASTRDHIVDAADRLFYRQGFEHTSFADIAAAVRISRGNVTYHFASKDEVLEAVIALRVARTRAMLDGWAEASATPADRIGSFIRMWMENAADLTRYGCPVGSLCGELAKLGHPAEPEAARLFALFRAWLAEQFALAGRADDADALAMHLLASSQGVAALANAFHDTAFIAREVDAMHAWLDACLTTPDGKEQPPCSSSS